MQLLHIDSSILGTNSVSRRLSAEVVAAEMARIPGMQLVYRDLVADPLGHINGPLVAVMRGQAVADDLPQALHTELIRGASDLDTFLASNVIVIGAPMYNFSIATQLKAWIDRLCVPGKTFSYGPAGVQGLCGGKRMIIASSRGGLYRAGTPMASLEHQESYLRSVFGFFGITDIQTVRAEGLAMADHRAESMAAARGQIAGLV